MPAHPHHRGRSGALLALLIGFVMLPAAHGSTAQPLPEPDAGSPDLGAAVGSPAECAGDLTALRDEWWEAVSAEPDAPLTTMILHRWADTLRLAPGSGPSANSWTELARRTRNGWNRRMMLGRALVESRRSDNPLSLESLALLDGVVRDWTGIGPFGRSIDAELHLERPALIDFDAERTEEGTHGPVRWRPLPTASHEPVIVPSRLSRRSGGSWILRSRFRVPVASERALLTVSTPGSARLLLDGEPLLIVDRAREHLPRIVRAPLSLPRGQHTLSLVSDGSPITIRFTDERGNAIRLTPVESTSGVEDAGWSPRPDGQPVGLPDLSTPPTSPSDRAARILLAIDLEDRLAVDRLLPAAPVEGAGAEALGIAAEQALRWLPWLPAEVTRTRLDRFRDAALAVVPEHVPVGIARARTLAEEDRVGDAMRLLDELVARSPRSIEVWAAREAIADREGWRRERRVALDALESIDPDHPEVLRRRIRLASDLARPDEVFRLRQRLHEVEPGFETAEILAEAYVARGELGKLAALTSQLARAYPEAEQLLRLRTRFARRFGVADIFEESLLPLWIERQPDDPQPWDQLAELRLETGEPEAALAALRRAGELDPGDASRARRIAHLAAGSPVPGRQPPPPWQDEAHDREEILASAPPTGSYPGANAVLLLDQMVSIVTEAGGLTEMVHQIIRLESQQAVDQYSQLPISGEVIELSVTTPDGVVLEPTGGSSGGGFTLPGLAPGALIEVRTERSADLPREQALELGPFFFQDPNFLVAFHRTEWIVHLPERWDPEVIRRGGAPEPESTVRNGVRRLAWRIDGSPRAEPEPFMPPPEHLLPNAQIRRRVEWAEVLPDISAGMIRDDRPTPTLIEAAAEILEGIEGRRARVQALYDEVCERITRPGRSSSATAAWVARDGDRNLLLAGLLRAAGISFQRVFAAPAPHRTPWQDWSSPLDASFAALLLRIEGDDGTPFFVQVPSRMARMGRIPIQVQGGRSLLLDETGGEWFTLPAGDPLDEAQAMIGTLRVEGTEARPRLEGSMEIRALGGSGVKERVRDMPPFQRSQMVGAFLQQILPGSKVEQGRFENFEEREDPLRLAFTVEAPSLIQLRDGQPSLASTLMGNDLKQLLRTSERTHPVFGNIDTYSYERITIELGEHAAGPLPEDVRLEGPWGRFLSTIREEEGSLVTERILELHPFLVPADRWEEFSEFCQQVDRRDEARIPLRRETP